MKISIYPLWIAAIGMYMAAQSGAVEGLSAAENPATNGNPIVTITVTGDFSFDKDGLNGRLMEGPMVLNGLSSPNTMLTVGQPSRGLYAEQLEIIFSYDSPPLESGTYEIVSLSSYQEEPSDQSIIVSVDYQEEETHPRDSVTYDQAVSGSLTLERGENSSSGEFTFSVRNEKDDKIELKGQFSNIEVLLLN